MAPLYSHIIDRYFNQLVDDLFCCETIQVKEEPQDDYPLESLPSADQQESITHLVRVIDCLYYYYLISHSQLVRRVLNDF